MTALAKLLAIALAQDQQQPCLCISTVSGLPVQRALHGGIPSSNAAAAALVAGHLIENVSVPLGLLFPLLYSAAQVLAGQFSIGQALSGVALGALFHVVQTRTPSYVRLIEFALLLVAGVTTLVFGTLIYTFNRQCMCVCVFVL